jgi:hypothetical protein
MYKNVVEKAPAIGLIEKNTEEIESFMLSPNVKEGTSRDHSLTMRCTKFMKVYNLEGVMVLW